jgi:hypothetical protein
MVRPLERARPYPELHFTPRELFVGVDSLVLGYVSANGQPAAEVILLDLRAGRDAEGLHYSLRSDE